MSRILIVEDEPDIALGLSDDLTIEGHQVEVVGDGEEGSFGADREFSLSPDGRSIAFVMGKITSREVWALENFLPAPKAKR